MIKKSHNLIFLVDDSKSNVAVLTEMLTTHGYEVASAYDGDTALQEIERIMPDLILLDVEMPGTSGFEVCRILKRRSQFSDTPIIMLTSLREIQDKVQGFEAGCVDYITKPFQLKEVRARVSAHLDIRNLQAELRSRNEELETVNRELRTALNNVKILSGLLPICASCKSVRDDDGYWKQVETYLATHADVTFTHGICPTCFDKLYGDVDLKDT